MTDVESMALAALSPFVGSIVARSIWQGALTNTGFNPEALAPQQMTALVHTLESGVRAFVSDEEAARQCAARLREAFGQNSPTNGSAAGGSLTVEISAEYDVVVARGQARSMCADLGFPATEQVKVATVVSELARNIVQYVGRGRIELELLTAGQRGIEIRAIDNGAGIPHIDGVLQGGYKSDTGMGMGLRGAQRLMDEFKIETRPGGGTRVVARRYVK